MYEDAHLVPPPIRRDPRALVGRRAVCKYGIEAIIEGLQLMRGEMVYVGRRTLDGTPWMSREPRLVQPPLHV